MRNTKQDLVTAIKKMPYSEERRKMEDFVIANYESMTRGQIWMLTQIVNRTEWKKPEETFMDKHAFPFIKNMLCFIGYIGFLALGIWGTMYAWEEFGSAAGVTVFLTMLVIDGLVLKNPGSIFAAIAEQRKANAIMRKFND